MRTRQAPADWSSPSFREALDRWDAGFGLKRITLNDATSDFEGEETVLTFLDLVNGSSLPCEANADVQIEKLSRLISFCDKWHAKSVANLAWEHLSRLATQKTSSGRALNYLPIFALASRWKRLDICAQLIRAGVPRNDEIVPELPPEHGRPAAEDVNLHDRGDSYVLDPAGMPYTRVKKIHSEYAWALGVLFQGLAVEQTRKMEAQLGELRRDDDTSCSRCPDCAARQFGVIQRDSAKIDWYQIAESFEGLIKGTMDSSSA